MKISPLTTIHNSRLLIMSNWSVLFDSILFNYVQEYARAHENVESHAQILKDCKGEIINSPLHEDNAVELPSGVCLVSKFIPSCYTIIATLTTRRPSENFFCPTWTTTTRRRKRLQWKPCPLQIHRHLKTVRLQHNHQTQGITGLSGIHFVWPSGFCGRGG